MAISPVLGIHITAGTLGMLSGFVAVFLRKGSRRHGIAGNVFVVAMLTLAASGTFLAIMKSQVTNVLGGVLTFYLVSTAWVTARRKDGKSGLFDWVALLFALAVGATEMTLGVEAAQSQTGLKYGYPAGIYFFIGGVVLLAAVGDVRMLVRGGISGTQRIARHLWRMCFGLFIAAASIFLARPQFFPALLRKTGALTFLSYLPLLLMIFWLIRIRVTKTFKSRPIGHPRPDSFPAAEMGNQYEPI
jgi:uncharacterized membrane protein